MKSIVSWKLLWTRLATAVCLTLFLILNCSTGYASGKSAVQNLTDEQRKELNQRCQKLADELDAADQRIEGLENRIATFRDIEKALRELVQLSNDQKDGLQLQLVNLQKQLDSLNRELESERQLRTNTQKELEEVKEKLKACRSARNRILALVGFAGLAIGVVLGVATTKD